MAKATSPVMNKVTPKERFLQSLDRCAADEAFIPSFYDRFLSTSDEVRNRFRFTDFEQQNQMLLRSLQLIAGATTGDLASLRELRERAETHDRHHLNIEPHLYDLWLDSVVKTVQEYDEQWDESTESAWRVILEHAVQQMTRYY